MKMRPALAALSLALAATSARSQQARTLNMPARNPWLADSVYAIAHVNVAQTDAVQFAGPSKGGKLTRAQINANTDCTSSPTVEPERCGYRHSGKRHREPAALPYRACGRLFELSRASLREVLKRTDDDLGLFAR